MWYSWNNVFSSVKSLCLVLFNTLRLRQNAWHFSDNIIKCIFLNENALISNKIWLKVVSKDPNLNNTALVQIMARLGAGNGLNQWWPALVTYKHHSTLMIQTVTPLQWRSHLTHQGHVTHTVETLYNTVNFCWNTHKRHSIARPKGRGMGCLLWVQRATYCVDLSKLSSIKYLL